MWPAELAIRCLLCDELTWQRATLGASGRYPFCPRHTTEEIEVALAPHRPQLRPPWPKSS